MGASLDKPLKAVFEDLQNSEDAVLKKAQCRRYLNILKRTSLAEQYANGKLAMILDVVPYREVEVEGTVPVHGEGRDILGSSRLILHRSAFESAVSDYWNQQLVLIDNIEIVKSPEGIIPSTIRLYVGDDRLVDSRCGQIYVSSAQLTFETLARFGEGESRVLVNDGEIDPLRDNKPCVIQRGSEIVNGVPDNQGHLPKQSRGVPRMILEGLCAYCTIYVDRGNVTLLQRQGRTIDVRNMLLGPVNL
jgi:hypothetical protein